MPNSSKSPIRRNSSLSRETSYPKIFIFYSLLAIAFLFRLAFGFFANFDFEDQKQVYLIGLKYYCTRLWPYFGPDVTRQVQVPGALQGLVVGIPLVICPIPEAPYIFLNILSFIGLCLFAWYCCKKLPNFPRWIIWTWLLTAPWVLDCSTTVHNVSYVLFGSIVFFIAFLETIPALTMNIIPFPLCNFMLGFSLFWVAQFHLSYVILIPYLIASFYFQVKAKTTKPLSTFFFFLLGCLTTGIFLAPTYLVYGFSQGTGGTQHALTFNPSNFREFFVILARLLSLASCEIPRFIGAHTIERTAFLKEYLWAAPFIIVAGIIGILQPLIMLLSWPVKKNPQKDWPAVKTLVLLTFLLIYISFLFAFKAPASHTYYLTLPIVMLYAFYVFSPWATNRFFLLTVEILFVCNILFHISLAIDHSSTSSLYKNRELFVKAIQEKNYHLLGERRPDTQY